MERSTYELIRILSAHAGLQLTVIAHAETHLPPNVSLLGTRVEPCPSEYLLHGDGRSKWDHIANDSAILEKFVSLQSHDVIHDLSSSTSSCILAYKRHLPIVKTLRLMPAHPSSRLTLNRRSWTLYISRFQRQADQTQSGCDWSVMYDFIPGYPKLHVENHTFVSVGRVESRKGHDIAAAVAAALGGRLVVIGRVVDESYADQLRTRFGATVLGELPHPAVVEHISKAAALIWTPRIPEPGGRVVLEALKAGIRVYAARLGVACDILEMDDTNKPRFQFDGIPIFEINDIPSFLLFDEFCVAEKHCALYTHVARSLRRASLQLA